MNGSAHPLLVCAVLACMLSSCATDLTRASSDPPPEQGTGAPRTQAVEPPDDAPRNRQLVQDVQAPVGPDLERLAKMFVKYALGHADSFPHSESLSMAIGGERVVSIDDVEAALPNREIWRICPAGWEGYGASSCPVDLIGPINDAVTNGAVLVYSGEYGEVTCAPIRSGPLPPGRLVVLRPSQEWRTCATDFAVALVADGQGRLRNIDLTLAAP